jgi:hypothetical protein
MRSLKCTSIKVSTLAAVLLTVGLAVSGDLRANAATGDVTTVAGSATPGVDDGSPFGATIGLTSQDFTFGPAGDMFFANFGLFGETARVRKLSAAGQMSTVLTVSELGDSPTGIASGAKELFILGDSLKTMDDARTVVRRLGDAGRPIPSTSGPVAWPLQTVRGVAVGSDDFAYVFAPGYILRYENPGATTVMAGSGVVGHQDGNGPVALIGRPGLSSITVGRGLNVYFLDGNRVRRMTPNRDVSTIAGPAASGYIDGSTASARFSSPRGITSDANGAIYVGDQSGTVIRKIVGDQVLTIAGTPSDATFADGAIGSARFSNIRSLQLRGNDLYVLDGPRLRKIENAVALGAVTIVSPTTTAATTTTAAATTTVVATTTTVVATTATNAPSASTTLGTASTSTSPASAGATTTTAPSTSTTTTVVPSASTTTTTAATTATTAPPPTSAAPSANAKPSAAVTTTTAAPSDPCAVDPDPAGVVGGRTFVDANSNGRFDAATDTELTGVTVRLLTTKNKRISSVVSDGCWSILAPKVGAYRVQIVTPKKYRLRGAATRSIRVTAAAATRLDLAFTKR